MCQDQKSEIFLFQDTIQSTPKGATTLTDLLGTVSKVNSLQMCGMTDGTSIGIYVLVISHSLLSDTLVIDFQKFRKLRDII